MILKKVLQGWMGSRPERETGRSMNWKTNALKLMALFAIIAFSLSRMIVDHQVGMMLFYSAVLVILVFASMMTGGTAKPNSPAMDEMARRSSIWWWMIAVFALAISTDRIASFVLLGILCFLALREFNLILPLEMTAPDRSLTFRNRIPVYFSYAVIPLVVLLAYIEWYAFFIILVPVYLFILAPILLVLQDRTDGVLQTLGIIVLGFTFFIYNLGHSLFLINISPMLLFFCLVLTEARDIISVALNGAFNRYIEHNPQRKRSFILNLRIAQHVNPDATYAGAALTSVITAILALPFVPVMPEIGYYHLTVPSAMACGLVIGIAGQLGELVFAMIRKDAASGMARSTSEVAGILDKIDSLIFTIPVTFHVIYLWYF